MKIAILGGGISGLSAYLSLQKNLLRDPRLKEGVSITLYETHDLQYLGEKKPTDIPSHGGGYGIAANGMASFRRLDPEIHDEILQSGFPAPKTWMKSARGWTLGVMPFADLRGEHPECCIMVLREAVIRILYKRIPRSDIVQHKVVEVSDGENKARIKLDNGDEQMFDLVIGADGVWSKTRCALIGDVPPPEYKYVRHIIKYYVLANYRPLRGLFTVGGFVPIDCLPSPPETGQAAHSQTVMTFGPNGFFAYTPYLSGDVKATDQHIRGEATLPPGKMAFWWSRSAQKDPKANPDEVALKKELEERHASWKDPTIQKILQNSEVRFKIPTFVLPKIPTWAGKRIVLVGDAAHGKNT
jgi:2-polyprenyl-6-methoxyphenol hydroxylase-like FAD-dependent oxidoreductase